MKFRIISNGNEYRIQVKCWYGWELMGDYFDGLEDVIFKPCEFNTTIEAEKAIQNYIQELKKFQQKNTWHEIKRYIYEVRP